ncbi:MAG: hypothetical protein H6974_11060 [Gammaproteobacteria bacterium]|nr:hypothetical protein [Gammaproteobacteria bacterium]
MWATLTETLVGALQADLPGVEVTRFADAQIPDDDTVRVLRGGSQDRPLFAQQSGHENLILECWTRHEDPALANQQLQSLENQVIAALRHLPRVDPIVNLSISGIDPDGDLFRPNLGSRIRLTIHWRVLRS